MSTLSPAAQAAVDDYRLRRDALRTLASVHRRKARPLHASKAEAAARRLHKAALAEEINPVPAGLPR